MRPSRSSLRGVVEREGAAIGVLITMQEATSHVRTVAAAAGFHDSPWGGSYPRIQILTVAQLLAGERIDYPDVEGMDRIPNCRWETEEPPTGAPLSHLPCQSDNM